MRKKQRATVIAQQKMETGICDLRLSAPEVAAEARAGQFVNLYCADKSRLLPRPISLAGIDAENGKIRLIYRVSGAGTEEFSHLQPGDGVEILGPLGNGFPVEEIGICAEEALHAGEGASPLSELKITETNSQHVYLIGGGIGIPPLLETAKAIKRAAAFAEDETTETTIEDETTETTIEDETAETTIKEGTNKKNCEQNSRKGKELRETGIYVTAVLGYRDSHTFLADEFAAVCDRVLIATEDGSAGTRGTVLDAIRDNVARSSIKPGNLRTSEEANEIEKPGKAEDSEEREESCPNVDHETTDVWFACGPTPMLRALKSYAEEHHIPCWLSLEERMACGVGACLACVCHTAEKDAHTQVHNRRVCKDGPVFRAEEIIV